MKIFMRFVLAAFVATNLISEVANATSIPMFNYSGGFSQPGVGQIATWGFQFTPTASIIVDGLGYFDAGSDGLVGGHRVGIWATNGTLLASAVVNTSNSSLLGPSVDGGQYRYTSIADLALSQGVTYVFGAAVEGIADVVYVGGTQLSPSPLVNIASTGVYDVTSTGFNFPTFTIGNTYGLGSFTARQGSEVPEPASLSLVALGLVAASMLRNRKARS